jgi:hypothetical protein
LAIKIDDKELPMIDKERFEKVNCIQFGLASWKKLIVENMKIIEPKYIKIMLLPGIAIDLPSFVNLPIRGPIS